MMLEAISPDFVLALSSIDAASDFIQIMKQRQIRDYAYVISHNENVLKIGESANGTKTAGERVYRQLANIPGWVIPSPRSPSGKDILDVIDDYQVANRVIVHKDDVSVEIYSADRYKLWYGDQSSKFVETQLLNNYEKLFDCLPIGNLRDTRKIGHSTTLTSLFEPE